MLIILLALTSSSFAQKSWIRVNQLGYTPKAVKAAVWAGKEDIAIRSFEIVDVLIVERTKTLKLPLGFEKKAKEVKADG